MSAEVLDLTPPTKAAKAAKAPKAEKAPKAPKAAKAPADPNAPKKERAPRQDYGFNKLAVIGLVAEKAVKYRGQRKSWYEDISKLEGKTVEAFLESKKDSKDPPRGWLRFFVQDGSVTLSKVDEAPTAKAV